MNTLGKTLGLAILIVGLTAVLFATANALFGGNDYQANAAQQAYDQAVKVEMSALTLEERAILNRGVATKSRQLAECVLANAKIADYASGFTDLSDDELNTLKTKCDFQ